MSRQDDSRYSGDNRSSRGPPPNRWDADRLAREREYRDSGYYDDYPDAPPARQVRHAAPVAPVYEERRYYEDDVYGPRGGRAERRYFEEEDDYYDPRSRQGQVIPFRPARPSGPPRPGQLLRRQSSLDTFDRPRRNNEYGRRPTRVDLDIPNPPSPRDNRYRPPQRQPIPRDYYDEYDDVQVQDPEYYGDDGYREYREREWVRSRRRDSPSHSRSRSHSRQRPEPADDHTSMTSVDDHRSEATRVSKKEIVIESKKEKKEKPYPRRGKTKMPKRLVHTKVLFDLGYPYYEEGDKTIIIEKALGPDNIDEIFTKSREYRELEVSTTRLLEAPPPGSTHTMTVRSPSPPPAPPSVRSERRTVIDEEIHTKPLSEAPRSVREWDNMTVKSSGTRKSQSRRSVHSRAPSSSSEESIHETIRESKTVIERSPSPSRTHRTSRSRARSRRRESFDGTEIIERRVVREEDDYGFDDSATIHVGPLALARARSRPRSDREIQEEIDRLRAERRHSRRERRNDRDEELIIERIDRRLSRSPSPIRKTREELIVERIARRDSRSPSRSPVTRSRGEIRVERRGDDIIEVKKERRDRSRSRPPSPPSSRLLKSMIFATT